jgi:hypothetical protein
MKPSPPVPAPVPLPPDTQAQLLRDFAAQITWLKANIKRENIKRQYLQIITDNLENIMGRALKIWQAQDAADAKKLADAVAAQKAADDAAVAAANAAVAAANADRDAALAKVPPADRVLDDADVADLNARAAALNLNPATGDPA